MNIDDDFDLSPLSALILQNAERILRDAKILFDVGSYATAGALACVSIEEAGKACLILWRDKGLTRRDITKDITNHAAKHRVFAGLKEAKSFVPLLGQKLERKEVEGRIFSQVLEPNRESNFLAKLGAYDAFKQYGLYVDIDDRAHFQPETLIHRGDVEYLIAEATLAVQLVREIPFVHLVACGMYFSEKAPARNPAMMRKIREMLASRRASANPTET